MIPKIIHFCWLSGEAYPSIVKKCIESWKIKLPDYEFLLWDRSKFDINSTLWTKQAFEAKKYAFASDYIRLHAVYNHGGIYLDLDVEVLKSFNNLIHLPYFIGRQHDDLIEAAIFGAEKNADWVLNCLKYYENRPFIKDNGEKDLLILPVIMQSQIEGIRKIIKIDSSQINDLKELTTDNTSFFLFPSLSFSPKNHQTGKISSIKKAYTIHHYDNSWLPFISKMRLKFIQLLGVNGAEKIIKTLRLRKIINTLKNGVK